MGAEGGAPRVAVWLTFAVAFLTIATGVTTIGTGEVVRPLATVIPDVVRQTTPFTVTVTGFLLLMSAFGLLRRYRIAWGATVVLLSASALQGLAEASPYALPHIALAVVALVVVVRDRRRFTRSTVPTTVQSVAGLALFAVVAYGTVGTYTLRDEFAGVSTPLDALYFTVVTASTIGFGDIAPTTTTGRLFVLSLVVLGPAVVAGTVGSLLTTVLDERLARLHGKMTRSKLERLGDHVVVLGSGPGVIDPVLNELRGVTDLLVVLSDEEFASELDDRGVPALVADPSDDGALRRAGIDRAKAVVAATSDDATNSLAVLTARQLNSDARIVAAAREQENVAKLERAGADRVISPAVVGRLLAESALDRESVGTADGGTRDAGDG